MDNDDKPRITRKPLAPSPTSSFTGSPQTTPGSQWTPTFSAFSPGLSSPPPTSHSNVGGRRGGSLRHTSQPYRSQTYELQLQDKRHRPSLGRDGSYHSHSGSLDGKPSPDPLSHLPYSPSHSRAASGAATLTPETSFSFAEDVPLTSEMETRSTHSSTHLLRSQTQTHTRGASSSSFTALPPRPPKPPSPLSRLKNFVPGSWTMILFLFLGIIGAASHHAFYQTLHGREAEEMQLQMLRYGTVLSFLTKAALLGAVLLAFRQRVWWSVQQGLFSVRALDALFAATDDITAVWNREVFGKATVAMILAIFAWSTPLVVILTSNTLTVQLSTITESTNCSSVRTLNFTHEESENWRTATRLHGLFGYSASFWNNTSQDQTAPGFFDYYDQPSEQFNIITPVAYFLGHPVPRDGAGDEICGRGWNCSYVVNFTAPGYRCELLAEGVGAQTAAMKSGARPPAELNTTMLMPQGDLNYYAITDRGEYARPQLENPADGGVHDPPHPAHLGAFRTEPVVWIGYSVPTDTDPKALSNFPNKSAANWNQAFMPRIFGCEHYYTAYSVRFNHTAGGTQTTTVLNRTFLAPVVNTVFQPGVDANDGTADNTTALPKENYILPTNISIYRHTAAYHSIGQALRRQIGGTMNGSNTAAVIAKTRATQTRLIEARNFPVADLMNATQSFYEDIILSFFAHPQLLAVSWASNPSLMSGKTQGNDSTKYPCERGKRVNVYEYVRRDLWVVYGLAILLATVGVALGFVTIGEGGEIRGMRFSDIVAATRGRGLDGVQCGREGVMLGYGLVPKGDGGQVWERNTMPGFGVEGEVQQNRVRRKGGSIFSGIGG